MKKVFIIFLCLLLPLGLFGCANSQPAGADKSNSGQPAAEKSDSYLGTWVIEKQLEGAPLGDFGNMELKDIIGKELTFSAKKASCFGDSVDTLGQYVDNPEYKKIEVPKSEFEQATEVTFNALGIKGDKITQIVVTKDPERNTGIVFYVVDNNSLLVNGAGTFFILTKKGNSSNNNTSGTNTDKDGAAVQESKTFADSSYPFSFKYPAGMKISLMNNNTVELVNGRKDTYFIRCEQKYVQDCLKQGLTYEGTAKGFVKGYVDSWKTKYSLSNYTESSMVTSDGSAVAEAIFNAQNSSGSTKVRVQATVMKNYLLATVIWTTDTNYANAKNELQSIMSTLAIK